MTYELGRARFIIDTAYDQAFRDVQKYVNETLNASKKLTKELAEQNKVRQSDVTKAASAIIAEEKRVAQERAKVEKDLANDRKKTTQETIKYYAQQEQERIRAEKEAANERKRITQETLKQNQQQYKQDLADWRALLKERDAANKEAENARRARARAIVSEENAIEKERLENVKRTLAEEKAVRDRNAKLRAQQERESAQASTTAGQGGVLGTGFSGAKIGATAATLLGFGAIASGTVIIRESIVALTQATLKQQEAQRALNASFGETSGIYKAHAEKIAQINGLSQSQVELGLAEYGVLQKQSNLSSKQIQDLEAYAVALKQAYGGDTRQIFRDVANAVLGETQALEKYGIVLQDNVLKNSEQLTEDERRRFTTMSESEKQFIRLRVIMSQLPQVQKAVNDSNDDAQRGFDKLSAAVEHFNVVAGKDLVTALGKGANAFGGWIESVIAANEKSKLEFQAFNELKNNPDRPTRPLFGIPGLPEVNQEISQSQIDAQVQVIKDRLAAEKQVTEEKQKQKQADIDAQHAEQDRVDRLNTAIKRQREIILAELEAAHDARVRDLDDQIEEQQGILKNKLDALEKAHRQELNDLEDAENARKRASEAELARINAEKDARQQANEDTHKQVLLDINHQKDAVTNAANEAIRQNEIQRDKLKRAAEHQKDADLKDIQTRKEVQDKARRDEDNKIADSIKERERRLEDSHKKTLHRIELEKEKAQDKYKSEERAIDKLVDKEEDRHRKRTQEIDDEKKQQLDAIDAQIKGIKDAQQARENARKTQELQDKIAEGQLNLRKAQGTQNPADRAAAQSKLVAAIRLGDPNAIKKAQDELVEIVGQGTEAIAKAQKDLATLQTDLIEEHTKQVEDAQVDQLEANKKRIEDESDLEKRHEDERDIRRKRRLEADKQAAKDRLDNTTRNLERQTEKENDANEKSKRILDDNILHAKDKLDERRKQQDIELDHEKDAVEERYKKEQEHITDTYDGEEHGYIPAIKRALRNTIDHYTLMEESEQARYDNEKKNIYDTYDNPQTGILAAHARAEKEAETHYQTLLRTVNQHYEDVKQATNYEYNDPDGKSGIIDHLKHLKEDANQALADVHREFEEAAKGLVGPDGVITKQWEDALVAANKYFNEVKRRGSEMITPRPQDRIQNTTQQEADPSSRGTGGGSQSSPQGNTNTTGQQIDNSQTVNEVDMSPNRYSVSFGYGQKYGGHYRAGPGWEADGNTAAWTNGPTRHKGIDLRTPFGIGSPVGSFTDGRVISTHKYTGDPDGDPGGNYVVIEKDGKTFWYMHLKNYTVANGDVVKRGSLIGYLGESGTEGAPHLHFEVRNGFNNGPMSIQDLLQHGIDPAPYVFRDSGYLFKNPTIYRDLITGQKGVLAERGPERLLGREQTAKFERVNTYAGTMALGMIDNSSVIHGEGAERGVSIGGDNFTYNGVAPESVISRWEADQQRRNLLRGIRGLVRR